MPSIALWAGDDLYGCVDTEKLCFLTGEHEVGDALRAYYLRRVQEDFGEGAEIVEAAERGYEISVERVRKEVA
jgi:hypothetical protein